VKFVDALKRGFSAFNAATSGGAKVVLAITTLLVLSLGWMGVLVIQQRIYEARESYRLEHLSSSENLAMAKKICKIGGANTSACVSIRLDDAIGHLKKIPQTAPEYPQASGLLELIRLQQQRVEIAKAAAIARAAQLANQSEQQSREQMLRNLRCEAKDSFTCGASSEGTPIMSFDNGHYWWQDDGRCAATEEKKRQAEKMTREDVQKAGQNQRDEDAQLSSYWPTTIRVDTDMDSFWLPDEERPCQTYPGDKGRVAGISSPKQCPYQHRPRTSQEYCGRDVFLRHCKQKVSLRIPGARAGYECLRKGYGACAACRSAKRVTLKNGLRRATSVLGALVNSWHHRAYQISIF
jgi:hypothetical protein